jgi:hypothetical protein
LSYSTSQRTYKPEADKEAIIQKTPEQESSLNFRYTSPSKRG